MNLALTMICLGDRPWDDAVEAARDFGFDAVEACSGGYFPKTHYDPAILLESGAALAAFQESVYGRGLDFAALCCCGNPVHPNPERAEKDHRDFVNTCALAEKLGVTRVGVLSGCPSGGPGDRVVNWIMNSFSDDPSPDLQEAYRWQWDSVLIPYWREAAKIADSHGVTICLEPIATNVVYNPETFDRLRDAVGSTIGMLFDPSHFFWQGIDVLRLIRRLEDVITYVHAKDVSFDRELVGQQGVASAVPYMDWEARPWVTRALGYGHPESFWREFVIALRSAGYEGPLSIEIEDPYLSVADAIRSSVGLLRSALPMDSPPTGNWFDVYLVKEKAG